MSEVIQWIVVAVLVMGAGLYLFKRFSRASRTPDCGGCCNSCPLGADHADKCSDTTHNPKPPTTRPAL